MILRLSNECNNSCKDCPDEGCKVIENIPYSLRKSRDVLFIVGGEPLIQKDVPLYELVPKLMEDFPMSKIVLCTNGRMFAYKKMVKNAIYSGISNFVIFFPENDPKTYSTKTGAEEGFAQVLRGIKELNKYPVRIVCTGNAENILETHLNSAEKANIQLCEQIDQQSFTSNIYAALKENLERKYQITITGIKPLWTGNRNLTFRIDTITTEFFLKINCLDKKEKAEQRLQAEENIITYLRLQQVMVPKIIHSNDGELSFQYNGRVAAVYEFVEGHLHEGDRDELLLATNRLAEYHSALKEYPKENLSDFKEKIEKKIAQIENLLKKQSSEKPALEKNKGILLKCERNIRDLCDKQYNQLAKGVIHGDFRNENVLFHGTNAKIVDLQNTLYGPRSYDLAVFIFSFVPLKEIGGVIDQIFSQYNQTGAIPEGEKSLLPVFMQIYLLSNLITRIYTIRGEDEQILTHVMNELTYLDSLTQQGNI
jgi:Ser/Thr protein kinase RdoA (MazF antagonist)